jgi:hypothetical protein
MLVNMVSRSTSARSFRAALGTRSCRAAPGIGAVGLVALIALVASACGGSPQPGGAPAAGQSGGPAGSTPAAGSGSASGSSGGAILNVCSLLPPTRVSAITGMSVGAATNTKLASGPDQISCSYAHGTGRSIRVLVVTSNSGTVFAAERKALGGGASAAAPLINVTGVGSKAAASAAGLAVLAGEDIVVVNGVPGEISGHYLQAINLAKAVISALD